MSTADRIALQQPRARSLRLTDLPALVARDGVQLLGIDAPPAITPSAKTMGVVELPASADRTWVMQTAALIRTAVLRQAGDDADRIAERVVARMNAAALTPAHTIEMPAADDGVTVPTMTLGIVAPGGTLETVTASLTPGLTMTPGTSTFATIAPGVTVAPATVATSTPTPMTPEAVRPVPATPHEAAAGLVVVPSSQRSSGNLAVGRVASHMDATTLPSTTIATSATSAPLREAAGTVVAAGAAETLLPRVAPPAIVQTGDELLTVAEVARVLAVRRSKAYEIWSRLPKVRLGPRCVRVRREALEDFLREQERRPRWR